MNFMKWQVHYPLNGYLDSESSSSSTSTTTPNLTDGQEQAMDDAENIYNDGGFYDPNYGGGNTTGVAGINQNISSGNQALSGFADQFYGSGAPQNIMDSAMSNLAPWQVDDELNAQIDSVVNQTTNQLLGNTMPTIDANAAAAGGVGGSRQGMAQGQAYAGANASAQNQVAQLTAADKAAHDNQQMQTLLGMNQITSGIMNPAQGQIQGGAVQQGQENLIESGELQKWLYESGVDLANIEKMLQLGSVGMGSTTTGNTTTSQDMTGQAVGAAAGLGSAAIMSDINLKDNIKLLHRTEHPDINVYSWDWNDKAKEIGLTGSDTGYIAQHVEQVFPEFVTMRHGYKAIFKDRVTEMVGG